MGESKTTSSQTNKKTKPAINKKTTTKKPSKPKNTAKQERFVKEYVKGRLATPPEPQYKASFKAYNIDMTDPTKAVETANAIATENLRKPSIKEAIDKALEKHHITIESAIEPIADALSATRVMGVSDKGDTIEVKDHTTRLKASGMALKLMGAEKRDTSGGTINFIGGNQVNVKDFIKND